MQFDALGSPGAPVIVMLNGSFTTGKGLLPIAEPLSANYRVILPTYDGHHENGGAFTTRADQAEKIYRYLLDSGVSHVAVLHGVSMGAEVAMELAKLIADDEKVTIGRAFLDGGQFFHFPAVFYKLVMRRKFLGFIKPGAAKSQAEMEKLLHSGIIRFMLGGAGAAEAYMPMLRDMADAAQYMTKQSVCNESDACYTFDPPTLPKELERRLVFSWSDNEPARKSAKRMKVAYPDAEYRTAGALGHCGYLVRQPQKYIELLQELAETQKEG